MKEIYDVFISYRRSDGKKYAEEVNNFFVKYGLRVFFDKDKMDCGKAFPSQIHNAVISAPHYILIGSPDTFVDRQIENPDEIDYVREEMKLACEYDTDERTIHVLNLPGVIYAEEKKKASKEITRLFDSTWLEYTDENIMRVFKEITAVNRQNIWYGAHRWLKSSKREGGRFHSLNIEESILPLANESDKDKKKSVSLEHLAKVWLKESPGKEMPLLETVMNTNDNLYLIGEGGIGKTTSLMQIMESAYEGKDYDESDIVPIFIELSFAPDSNYGEIYSGGESTFIRRSVFRQIRTDENLRQVTQVQVDDIQDIFSLPYKTAVEPVNRVLCEEDKSPEYLLLLDGMNEVSTLTIKDEEHHIDSCVVYQMITAEIAFLAEKCPNVRIILTSRSDDYAINNDFTRLYLSGIKETEIRNYLEKSGVSKEKTDAAVKDKLLLETVSNPLFLTMYAKISDTNELNSRGEIFKAFFHERACNIDIYTMQSRLEKAEKDMAEISYAKQSGRIDSKMLRFILDFILPEIAWHMEREGWFYCKPRLAKKWIMPLLTDFHDNAIAGDFGCELFADYQRVSGKVENIRTVAERFTEYFGTDTALAETIFMSAVTSLGLMQITNGEYGFIHQHIRDYFAAVKNINTMRLSVYMQEEKEDSIAFECMEKWFANNPVGIDVRRFMGEYLGEHKNKPYYNNGWNYSEPTENCDRNLINRALKIYSNHFDKKIENGYALYSLIEILKDVRKDLSGFDFSGLDLWNIRLNDCHLSRPGIPAVFTGAKVNFKTFGPYGHTNIIYSVQINADGSSILTASGDGTAIIWDSNTFREIGKIYAHRDIMRFACYSNDGEKILCISRDTASVWNASTLTEIKSVRIKDCKGSMLHACFSPDGNNIAIALTDGTVRILSYSSLEEIAVIKAHNDSVRSVSYSKDGNRIVTTSGSCFALDYSLKVWDSNSLCKLGETRAHTRAITTAYFSSDSKYIITASEDQTVCILDSTTLIKIHTFRGVCACFSPNGSRIFVASSEGIISIYDGYSYGEIAKINNILGSINSICFSPDGKRIFASLRDGRVEIWNANTYRKEGELKGHKEGYCKMGINRNRSLLAIAGNDNSAKIVDTQLFRIKGVLIGEKCPIQGIEFNPEGKEILTVSTEGKVKIWDRETFRALNSVEVDSLVYSAGYSPDGNMIVLASLDKTAKIYNSKTLREVTVLKGHKDDVIFAGFIPNGTKIITISFDETIKIWDSKTFEEILSMKTYVETMFSACFSSDSKKAVFASDRGVLKIWDTESFKELGTITNEDGTVTSADFSPDNRRLIVVAGTDYAKVFDACSLEEIHMLKGHKSTVKSAKFTQNGEKIITVSQDDKVKIWDAETFECLETIENIPGVFLVGCDLSALHADSKLSDNEQKKLYQLGAVL